ncbi:MAG TPA: DUF512 domain-containing protein [candidate division Zixibacteria bacterium]|jgi:putative radical SAM enzyme (TIGR03279 family)
MPIVRHIHHHDVIPEGNLHPGDEIVAINGQPLRDVIDAKFFAAEEELELQVRHPDGRLRRLHIIKDIDADLGIEYEPDPIRICKANCDFCFVKQQPRQRRMRRTLHIKDDDYRLSFLHGNFVTLTNMSEDDYARIFEQRLSPLYVSVHSTDDAVRREFLRKPDAEPIVPLLKRLHTQGIDTHTQIVVTPSLNDGAPLWRSFDDLLALYPRVPSVGVVPIGLTKHREKLPTLPLVTQPQAVEILREIGKRHDAMRRQHGVGVIYAADEMYLIADEEIPSADYYDDYCQLENGLGLIRQLLDGFEERESELPRKIPQRRRLCLATATSAGPFIERLCRRINKRVTNLELIPLIVRNDFWGHTVTVSGLLTGTDIAAQFRESGSGADALIVPPDCLNTDDLFLDDETIPSLSEQVGVPVLRSEYDFVQTVLNCLAA